MELFNWESEVVSFVLCDIVRIYNLVRFVNFWTLIYIHEKKKRAQDRTLKDAQIELIRHFLLLNKGPTI